jgi:hypothetical protein
MTAPHERRRPHDRRTILDRRSGVSQLERSPGGERRINGDRRSGAERRASLLSVEDQIRDALRLLTQVVERGKIPDEERRSLEGAVVRLRFALDRLEPG